MEVMRVPLLNDKDHRGKKASLRISPQEGVINPCLVYQIHYSKSKDKESICEDPPLLKGTHYLSEAALKYCRSSLWGLTSLTKEYEASDDASYKRPDAGPLLPQWEARYGSRAFALIVSLHRFIWSKIPGNLQ